MLIVIGRTVSRQYAKSLRALDIGVPSFHIYVLWKCCSIALLCATSHLYRWSVELLYQCTGNLASLLHATPLVLRNSFTPSDTIQTKDNRIPECIWNQGWYNIAVWSVKKLLVFFILDSFFVCSWYFCWLFVLMYTKAEWVWDATFKSITARLMTAHKSICAH